MNLRLKIIITVVAVILVVVMFGILSNKSTRNTSTLQSQNPIDVKVVQLDLQPLQTASDLSGTVLPQLSVILSAQITAQVKSVTVHSGDPVKKGQLLVSLNPADLMAASQQANAALLAAKSQLTSAKVAATMTRSLQATKLLQAESALAGSQAALHNALANQHKVDAGPRLQVRQEAAQATAATKAEVDLASKNLSRMRTLYAEGAISAQQFDDTLATFKTAQAAFLSAQQQQSMADQGSRPEDITAAAAQVQQAKAAVQQAKAAVQQARIALMQTTIARETVVTAAANESQQTGALQAALIAQSHTLLTSPIDGYVTDRMVDPGTMASPGVPLLQLQGGKMRLAVSVPSSDLNYIKLGDKVPVHIGNRDAVGVVQEISPMADSTAHTLIVKILLPNSVHAVSGEYGNAQIVTGRKPTMMIPSSAVVKNEGLDYTYVVTSSSIAAMRIVTLGQTSGDKVQVLSGLEPGDRVIISNLDQIKSGVPVTVEGE